MYLRTYKKSFLPYWIIKLQGKCSLTGKVLSRAKRNSAKTRKDEADKERPQEHANV
jgi:hypothetical protein